MSIHILKITYYEKKDLILKLFSDSDCNIKGVEIISYNNTSNLLNLISYAITNNLKLETLIDFDSCYNPFVSEINNPISICAKYLEKKIKMLNNN